MVEFALVAPLLVLLLFGIFEFGFLFGQYLDVRHGARETARLASVNFNPDDEADPNDQAADIVAAGCQRMDLAGSTEITLDLVRNDAIGRQAGAFATITAAAPATQITGFFAPIIDSIVLESEIEIRLEQDATFDAPYVGQC